MWTCSYCGQKFTPCGSYWSHLEKVHPQSPEAKSVKENQPKVEQKIDDSV